MCLSIAMQRPQHVLTPEINHLGFDYQITKTARGYRCGYVKVKPGHPWFGKQYDFDLTDVDVHGRVTFTEFGTACPTHEAEEEWWIGFDCAHGGDAPDPELSERSVDSVLDNPLLSIFGLSDIGDNGHVWSQAEVIEECKSVCEQAAAACK